MAKTKKSRDRKPKTDKPNPFDLKFANKKNMTAKGARTYVPVGKPSAARSKAMEKREKTIGVEYRRQGCVNQIVDHRIAERSNLLNAEEKASLRFAELKKKQIGKRNIFNLDEPKEKDNEGEDGDYVFTHKGKSLSEVQRFERGEADDNNELDGDVVALANFGGEGLDVKVTDEEGLTRKYSRKDVINEVITNSKNAKYIRQMAKDDITLATENIDERFKLMKSQGLMEKLKDVQNKSDDKRVMEDYDEIVSLLQF
uniref:Nucleolar protein 16 n=1 Tax=Panagrolaimus davidi TaxID=227884 RepID=A0A914QRY5_9BILA